MVPIDLLKPFVTHLGLVVGLMTRAMTLGVRGVVADGEGRVLLVRHTYLPGWYLPGGGVEPGETLAEAMSREILEETGVLLKDAPRLVSMHLNRRASRRDHVALFVGTPAAGEITLSGPNREIAEVGFFAREALPEGTTAATLRRLAEVLDGAPAASEW